MIGFGGLALAQCQHELYQGSESSSHRTQKDKNTKHNAEEMKIKSKKSFHREREVPKCYELEPTRALKLINQIYNKPLIFQLCVL